MSDTKVSNRLRFNAPPQTDASASGGTSRQQVVLGHSSPAMAYWQGVAAAGRTAKPVDEAGKRQTFGQRPVAWAKP